MLAIPMWAVIFLVAANYLSPARQPEPHRTVAHSVTDDGATRVPEQIVPGEEKP